VLSKTSSHVPRAPPNLGSRWPRSINNNEDPFPIFPISVVSALALSVVAAWCRCVDQLAADAFASCLRSRRITLLCRIQSIAAVAFHLELIPSFRLSNQSTNQLHPISSSAQNRARPKRSRSLPYSAQRERPPLRSAADRHRP